jgi:quercetin dioxygenase-like cupin family protein
VKVGAMTMRAGEVYEHPYERLVVRVGTAESAGKELVAEVYVRPGAPGVPRHAHPELEEALTVIRGQLDAWVAGERSLLGPGGRVEVPPGVPHSWRPVGDEEVSFLLEVRPGSRFEEMWRQFMGLFQDGKAGPQGPSFLQSILMAREFSDVMQLVGPPLFLQRVLFATLAVIARARGYKSRYDEYLTRGPSSRIELEPQAGESFEVVAGHER